MISCPSIQHSVILQQGLREPLASTWWAGGVYLVESYGGQAAHSFGREASTFRAGELTESAEERGAPGVLRNQVRGVYHPFHSILIYI